MKLMLETSYSLQQESANMFDTPRSCEHVLVSMKCALCGTLPAVIWLKMIFPERIKAPTCAWLSFPFHSVGPTLTVFVIGASTASTIARRAVQFKIWKLAKETSKLVS